MIWYEDHGSRSPSKAVGFKWPAGGSKHLPAAHIGLPYFEKINTLGILLMGIEMHPTVFQYVQVYVLSTIIGAFVVFAILWFIRKTIGHENN